MNNKVKLKEFIKLDIENKLPLYCQLKNYIIQEIESGNWKSEEMLPYEDEICKYFEISKAVVRQTLQELKTEGFIITKKGKGTFVAKPLISENISQNLVGFYETWTSSGFKVQTNVLNLEKIKPPYKIAQELNLDEEAWVIFLKRLYKLDEKPFSIGINYIPYNIAPGLLNDNLQGMSLNNLLESKYNVLLSYGKSFIEVIFASKEQASLLQISKGSALFFIEGTCFSSNGKPLNFFQSAHIAERNRIQIDLIRNQNIGNTKKNMVNII